MKNTEISQNCWRPTVALEKVNEDGKEERQDSRGREGAWLAARIQFSAYLSQMGAHHIVRSVHTQRPSVFIPNGHQLQFSSNAPSATSIHALLLVQTNKQILKYAVHFLQWGDRDDPKRQVPSLFSINAFVVSTISPVYHFVGSFDAAIIREAMAIQLKPGFEDKGGETYSPSVFPPDTGYSRWPMC